MVDLKLLDEVPPSQQVRRAYDIWSICYDKVAAPWEHGPRLRGLEAANLRSGEKVLDVGVGTGAVALRILARRNQGSRVYGVDISLRMLAKARRRISAADGANAHLLAADARAPPFRERVFDVVYSAYTLDLMTFKDVALALSEFRRVLKPDGRMVLVNMSKELPWKLCWFERIYEAMPTSCAAYLLGGCRPVVLDEFVRQAGFHDVQREFIRDLIPSEIVTARKPGGKPADGVD
jgi:ubiquinone/menaquinone biosynthesis C-methylase UbiE